MAQELVTTGDVARTLGVTLNTVKAWIRAGRLGALRLPSGHYRIPRDELDRLLDEGSQSRTNRQRELFAERRRAWQRLEDWERKQPASDLSLEERLAWLESTLEFARERGDLIDTPIEDKVRGVRRLHETLACLSS